VIVWWRVYHAMAYVIKERGLSIERYTLHEDCIITEADIRGAHIKDWDQLNLTLI
jgi:DNA gyrase/topoisomerase IV subunit B